MNISNESKIGKIMEALTNKLVLSMRTKYAKQQLTSTSIMLKRELMIFWRNMVIKIKVDFRKNKESNGIDFQREINWVNFY
jgi:hypothetical protein